MLFAACMHTIHRSIPSFRPFQNCISKSNLDTLIGLPNLDRVSNLLMLQLSASLYEYKRT